METRIFATRTDLLPGIEKAESMKDLHYAVSNMLEVNIVNEINSLLEIEELGCNNSGKYVLGTQYLVLEKKYEIKSTEVKQKKGGYLYDIGPLNNPHSIIFQPGGICKDNYIIRGSIGTIGESKVSKQLYEFFRKEILRGFKKIKGWYIGSDAFMLAKSGCRLITMHIEQPLEYDLSID